MSRGRRGAALATLIAIATPQLATAANTARLSALALHLQGDDERPFSFGQLAGHPFVVVMGYTSCRVRCPLTLDLLRRIEAAYLARGIEPSIVLVTLDPRQDTAAKLRTFRESRRLSSTRYYLLRTTPEETRALARFLDIGYTEDAGHIDHDSRVVVFDAHGERVRSLAGWHFDPAEAVVP